MTTRPRIALMTIFQVPNYGSVLQAFATQHIFGTLGYECDVVNYSYPNSWHMRHMFSRTRRLRMWVKGMLVRSGILSPEAQSHKIDLFRRRYLHLTRSFPSLEALEKADWSRYRCVVAGSDQIWNPRFLNGDKAYMLSFVPDCVRKVSIASSIAFREIPAHLVGEYRRYLSRFDSLSVRDNNGTGVIRTLLGPDREVRTILDPTLLLSGDEWVDSLSLGEPMNSEEYIFVYLLDYAFNPYPYVYEVIEEMKRRYGSKVIAGGIWHKPASPSGVEVRTAIGPEEYVDLIRNARCVITNSFHGTAFAVNFGRPLASIVASDDDDRQSSLLNALGLEACVVRRDTPVRQIEPGYDPVAAAGKLAALRADNLHWISTAL